MERNTTEATIRLAPELYMARIASLEQTLRESIDQIGVLKTQLAYERELRESSSVVSPPPAEPQVKKSRKQRIITPETNTYSDFKSDGKRKAHAADSIRSYSDFKAMQDYFLSAGKIRDWAMWTIGVSLGLRVSDLLSLRFFHLIEPDKRSYKPRIQIYEKKTGKLNDILVTEAVRSALDAYLAGIKHEFDLDGFLFPSYKTKGKIREECGWRILSQAGRAVGLPLNIGSHTMRKSFANIAACVDKSSVDMNSITKIQGLLNHSDQRVTMRYLQTYQDMYNRARIAVSDFVLGKSGVEEIIAGNQTPMNTILEKLDALEEYLQTHTEVT